MNEEIFIYTNTTHKLTNLDSAGAVMALCNSLHVIVSTRHLLLDGGEMSFGH